jgi:hypothetical protein
VNYHGNGKRHKALCTAAKEHPDGWLEGVACQQRRWRYKGDGLSVDDADGSMVDCTAAARQSDDVQTTAAPGQRSLRDFTFPSLDNKDRRQHVINAQAAHFVLDNRPVSGVLRKGFRHLVKALRPNYTIASRATTYRTILAQKEFLRGRLRELVKKSCSLETPAARKFDLPAGLHVPYIESNVATLHHRAGFASWEADLWTSGYVICRP